MKINRNKNTSTKIFEDIPTGKEILKNIDNLTVEDVVVLYAYAEAIVETVREPLIILDKSLRVKKANKSFFNKFKVTEMDTYNRNIFEIGNKQWNIPELKKLFKELLPKSKQINDFEVSHNFEDIGNRIMLLNARRITLKGHKTELILLAIEDITQRKIIEKHKDDIIGIVSHELKTPLTSIKLFVQILQSYNQKTINKRNAFLLNNISKQIDKLENIMVSFLNVYALQTGRIKIKKQHFFIEDLLIEIIETFQYSTKKHKIIRKGKATKEVYADKERISQVLTNLLSNAIKYSPESDKVIVGVDEDIEKITISVKDFGIGIPKEQHQFIFDRFFRWKGKGERKIQGVGLGLYIASEIVKEHNGKMWVKSEIDKGSTFYFTLLLKNK